MRFKISLPWQITIGILLALLIFVTRGHHFASITLLPGASWAVFFLAGVYLPQRRMLLFYLLEVVAIDLLPVLSGSPIGFCISPAYPFLIPAYSALWFAGRLYSRYYQFKWQTLLPLALFGLAGVFVCQILSTGGFYWFSGRYTDQTMTEMLMRIVRFYPTFLSNAAFYVGLAVIVHGLVGWAQQTKLTIHRTD